MAFLHVKQTMRWIICIDWWVCLISSFSSRFFLTKMKKSTSFAVPNRMNFFSVFQFSWNRFENNSKSLKEIKRHVIQWLFVCFSNKTIEVDFSEHVEIWIWGSFNRNTKNYLFLWVTFLINIIIDRWAKELTGWIREEIMLIENLTLTDIYSF